MYYEDINRTRGAVQSVEIMLAQLRDVASAIETLRTSLMVQPFLLPNLNYHVGKMLFDGSENARKELGFESNVTPDLSEQEKIERSIQGGLWTQQYLWREIVKVAAQRI